MQLPYDPGIPLLGTYLKNPKALYERMNSPYVHCSIVYNCQDLETALLPNQKLGVKKVVEYLHNATLLGYKKKGNLILWDSMNGPGDYCAK